MAYKALTYINLPFIEVRKAPGERITNAELKEAQQTQEDIDALIAGGSISGDMDAEIHPQNIIPDPTMPTIQSVVAQAQSTMKALEGAGQEVPKELRTLATMETSHVTGGDTGASDDRNR